MMQDEARELLDSMLYPFSKERKCIEADETLSKKEKSLLLQIVIDFKRLRSSYNYQKALSDIALILGRYVTKATISTAGTKIPKQPDAVPFLIKQVLFFIAVSCMEYKLPCSQNNIINSLNTLGVPLSHNFFSRMHTTPRQYVAMMRHKPPKLPTNYMGQKHKELAVAIKNLVYQAGKYDIFCDIFGGSGAASLAVDRRKNVNYVYNEQNRVVYNLFKVLVDDKLHMELINELELLQKDLRGDGAWLEDEGYDFDAEVQQFFGRGKGIRKDREQKVKEDGSKDLDIGYNKIVKKMSSSRQLILNMKNDYKFTFEGETYDKSRLLKDIFPDAQSDPSHMKGYACFMSFFRNYRLITECEKYFRSMIGGEYTSGISGETVPETLFYSEKRHNQYRFYKYYAYFYNLVNKPGAIKLEDMVRYAVAEIFLQYLTTNGSMGISAVLRMNFGADGASKKSNEPEAFLREDFREKITGVHRVAKGTICERLDCIDVIKKYKSGSQKVKIKHNAPLFYSDSPYAGTKDYKDEKNGVNKFDSHKMRALISELRNSGDNFIFSCRAVKGSENGAETTEKLKKANYDIFGAVYMNFIDIFQYEDDAKRQNLWVLAVIKENEKYSFADLISKNRIAEIMITNFEIHGFSDPDYPDTRFEVYEFSQVLGELISNANV